MTRRAAKIAVIATLFVGSRSADARTEGRALLLRSQVGEATADVSRYVEALVGAMGERQPIYGEDLRRALHAQLSISPGPLRGDMTVNARVEKGRREFLEGNYGAAIELLEEAREVLLSSTAAVAADQTLRDTLHRALLWLAHAYLREKKVDQATERVSEAIRSFADREPSLTQYSPELVNFYKQVRREMRRQRAGTLIVQTNPPGCMVFVNERFVGLAPTSPVADLYPGKYRVYVQRGKQRGRVHMINIAGQAKQLSVDFLLDAALITSPVVGLRFATASERAQRDVGLAADVGRALSAPSVMLVGVEHYQGRRAFVGRVIAAATGQVVRSGIVVLEPAPPGEQAFAALGRFMLGGQPEPGVIVRDGGSSGGSGSGFFSAGVQKWVTLGVGVAAVAAGVTLIALDGSETCNNPPGVKCKALLNTRGAGIGVLAGGAAFGALSTYLFIRDARRKQRSVRAIGPWIGPRSAGLWIKGRF